MLRNILKSLAVATTLLSISSHAIFINGGFETGNYSGWTTGTYYNLGLSDPSPNPYTGANIQLQQYTQQEIDDMVQQHAEYRTPEYVYPNWGYNGSMTYQEFLDNVWNAPYSGYGALTLAQLMEIWYPDAQLPFRVKTVNGTFTDPNGAPLTFARAGNYSLMLNNSSYNNVYDDGNGNLITEPYNAAGGYVNSIAQSDTIKASDRDSVDGRLHVRFSYAAVLDNPQHDPYDQPYFYLRVRNVTKGTVLYEDFAFADPTNPKFQPIPNPTYPVGYFDFLYMNWQDVDVIVPDADLGDTIEVYLIAADCAQGGHSGYAYLDGFGSRQVDAPDVTVAVPSVGQAGLAGLGLALGIFALVRLPGSRRRMMH